MPTANERRIRAGYDLFLAANPDNPADWGPNAPVAALMHDQIAWTDDDQQQPGRQAFNGKGDGEQDTSWRENPNERSVLSRLRQLRKEMPCCQIMSCVEVEFEDEQKQKHNVVHTVDHALKDPNSAGRPRPHFCASSFEFDGEGKVVSVHYCSGELPLDVPLPGLLGGNSS